MSELLSERRSEPLSEPLSELSERQRAASPAGAAGGASRWPLLLLLVSVTFYLFVSLRHLDVVPPVYEDEPWQASTGWKLAREGVFGSDLFAGLDGMDRRYYAFLPVHPMLLAGAFEIGGVGLRQARLETVAVGLAVLLLTFELGRRLRSAELGALAAALLVTLRWSYSGRYQATGIVFLDMARIARYDMEVPAFGLAALIAFAAGCRGGRWPAFAATGLLVAFAGLSHLHGLFWLPALVALGRWQRLAPRAWAAMAAAFALPWLLYGLYVAADPAAWRAQFAGYAPRFGLFDWRWYADNLAREPERYTQALTAAGGLDWARPGLLLVAAGIPASLIAMLRAARREGEDAVAARVLLVPTMVLPVLFALLLWLKLVNYLVVLAPLVALTLAWGVSAVWRSGRRRRWLRVGVVAALAAIGLESASRIVALERRAAETTPWVELAADLRRPLTGAERVLVLHHYWFGLEGFDVRSWAVPLSLAWDRPDPALALRRELDRLAPDAVVIEPRMRQLFEQHPWVEGAVDGWLGERGFRRVDELADETYGRLEVFRRHHRGEGG